MKEPFALEIRTTINKIPNNKAAGCDGADINSIKFLIEDDNPPLVEILRCLFEAAFKEGATLLEESCDTMIPKRKEDGWTDRVRDMRPISLLQEFGKIADGDTSSLRTRES